MIQQEDSIPSSPILSSSTSKYIHKVRSSRKSRLKTNSKKPKSTNEAGPEICFQLYGSSDDETLEEETLLNATFLVSSHVRDFVPYQMESMLMKADRLAITNLRNNLPKQDGGFLTCERWSEQQNHEDPKLAFITDSELLDCCREADKSTTSTPHKQLRLVNSILEDFALSPYTTKSIESRVRYWEYSPQFMLKNKPEKTYSRKHCRNINKRLQFNVPSCSDDEDNESRSSSFISVQENSQVDDVHNTTVIPDQSEKLSENLLNLSTYFTQEPLMTDESAMRSSSPFTIETTVNIHNLLQEICHLRSQNWNRDVNRDTFGSEDDFEGFPSNVLDECTVEEISLAEDCCLDETLLSPDKLRIPTDEIEIGHCHEVHNSSDETSQHRKSDFKYDWNDDCAEVFALIKTQEVLQQQKIFPCGLATANNILIKNECLANSQNINGIEFKTASSKPIHVSKEAEMRALEIVKNLPAITMNEKYQMVDGFSDKPSTSKAALTAIKEKEKNCKVFPSLLHGSIRFQTGNGKKIDISKKALKNVENILKEFSFLEKPYTDSDLNSIKDITNNKNHSLPKKNITENQYWENEKELANIVFSEWPLEEQLQGKSLVPPKSSNNCSNVTDCLDGFQTAGGRKLKVSAQGEKAVAHLLQEFQADCNNKKWDEDLVEIKSKIQRKCSEQNAVVFPQEGNRPTLSNEAIDFHTAAGNKLAISAKGQKAVDHLLKEFQSDFGINKLEEDLLAIKIMVQKKHSNQKRSNDLTDGGNSSTFRNDAIDFQTAGGKKLAISSKGQQAVAHLLQEFQSDCNMNKWDEDLVEIKSKIHKKQFKQKTNKDLDHDERKTEWNVIDMESKIQIKHNEQSVQDTVINSANSFLGKSKELSLPAVTLKRSMEAKSTPLPPSKRILTDVKQSFSELSMRSPLNTSAAKSVISRKNLLSLSKKRKQKGRLSTNDAVDNNGQDDDEFVEIIVGQTETPIKIKSNTAAIKTPGTPNVNDFFHNAPIQSSTPRTREKPVREEDFKPIAWNVNNITSTDKPINISENSSCNITINSSNPTVEERIGRLNMYGNPPAISPIATESLKNCRPSGLRRTRRSMPKKYENI
uniref:Uncharacterized protein n=1 Tax=Stomoxys calcitrans TaxID=35570 RepID=A0A1I8PVC9_STOCA